MVAEALSTIILMRKFLTCEYLAIFKVSTACAIYKTLKDYFPDTSTVCCLYNHGMPFFPPKKDNWGSQIVSFILFV